MIRKVITIVREKCNGCGLCAKACHEGAIGIVAGKAKLLREDYCDGLGDCLPACPVDAISFELREAAAYDRAAVEKAKGSALQNFPVQLKLAPANAPYFKDADLLIAADCTAYAYANFHRDFIAGKVTLIGCPKLDGVNYAQKLTQILENGVATVTVVRMSVPCCGGLSYAVQQALENSGKKIPLSVITIGPDGQIQ